MLTHHFLFGLIWFITLFNLFFFDLISLMIKNLLFIPRILYLLYLLQISLINIFRTFRVQKFLVYIHYFRNLRIQLRVWFGASWDFQIFILIFFNLLISLFFKYQIHILIFKRVWVESFEYWSFQIIVNEFLQFLLTINYFGHFF